MRKDMSKVIVERPRKRDAWRGAPGRPPRDLDLLPGRAGMKKTHWGRPAASKELNENLAPLFRFLRGQVGRPWDKVFSELNANIKRGNTVQEHILTHLDEMIARQVAPVPASSRFPCGLVHVHKTWGQRIPVRPGELYVDPKDGIVKLARRRFFDRETPREVAFMHINEGEVAVKVEGVWFAVKVRRPDFSAGPVQDVLLGEVAPGDGRRLHERYGAELQGLAKRQLSGRELRNLGLSNDPA